MNYSYDLNDNRTIITHSDGVFFDYGYDNLNRLKSIVGRNNGIGIAGQSYDNQGRLFIRQFHYSDHIIYYYDPISRLNFQTEIFFGNVGDVQRNFTHNPAGQIVSRVRSNDAYAFAGDVNLNRSYATNGLNQYTAAGAASFTYDANGNLTSDGGNV